MREVERTARFQRDVKACKRRHWEMEPFKEVIASLVMSDEKPIPSRYKPHALQGELRGYAAVHAPTTGNPPRDTWVILFAIAADGTLILMRTGTHDEVYGKSTAW